MTIAAAIRITSTPSTSPTVHPVDISLLLLGLGAFGGACEDALRENADDVPFVVRGSALVADGFACGLREPRRTLEGLLGRRLADQRLLGPAHRGVAADRREREARLSDAPVLVERERGAGGHDRPVADAAI